MISAMIFTYHIATAIHIISTAIQILSYSTDSTGSVAVLLWKIAICLLKVSHLFSWPIWPFNGKLSHSSELSTEPISTNWGDSAGDSLSLEPDGIPNELVHFWWEVPMSHNKFHGNLDIIIWLMLWFSNYKWYIHLLIDYNYRKGTSSRWLEFLFAPPQFLFLVYWLLNEALGHLFIPSLSQTDFPPWSDLCGFDTDGTTLCHRSSSSSGIKWTCYKSSGQCSDKHRISKQSAEERALIGPPVALRWSPFLGWFRCWRAPCPWKRSVELADESCFFWGSKWPWNHPFSWEW